MISFNRLLISTAAALIASQAEAKSIHNSCLQLSDNVEGNESGDFMTNEDQLTTTAFSDDMRLHSFTTCTDDQDNVTGIQFFMALNPYDEEEVETVQMAPIGQMLGFCHTVKPSGRLHSIKAAGGNDGVTGIKYTRGEEETQYGSVPNRSWKNTEWEFKSKNPLVGLYGRQSERGIEQIGFITLDTVCQVAAEELIEENVIDIEDDIDETVVEPKETEDGTVVIPEEHHEELEVIKIEEIEPTNKESSSATTTIVVIVSALVIFSALLAVSIKVFQHQKGKATASLPVQTPPRKTNTKSNQIAKSEDLEAYATAGEGQGHGVDFYGQSDNGSAQKGCGKQ